MLWEGDLPLYINGYIIYVHKKQVYIYVHDLSKMLKI
jgi:hypothetical protein